MSSNSRVTGRLVAAARSLTGVSREKFAGAAGLTVESLDAIESNGSAWLDAPVPADGVCRAFETFGVVIIDESDGMGAGVRLKFTRQDVRQIGRLEGEGGMARSDDAP